MISIIVWEGAALLGALAFGPSAQVPESKSRWATCVFEASGGIGKQVGLIVINPISYPANERRNFLPGQFEDEGATASILPGYERRVFVGGIDHCEDFDSEQEAQVQAQTWLARDGYSIRRAVNWKPLKPISQPQTPATADKARAAASHASGKSEQAAVSNDKPDKALSDHQEEAEANAEAERLAGAKLNAAEAERQRLIAEEQARQKAEGERRKREHEERVAAAAAAKADWEKQVAASRAREADYQRQLAAHSKQVACLKGERAACSASTDTDANRCVTSASLKLDDTFKGNTSATVVNGCPVPVDVRICLMREGGWNCGVGWGISPQRSFGYSSFAATGQVFTDARTSGSNRPLSKP